MVKKQTKPRRYWQDVALDAQKYRQATMDRVNPPIPDSLSPSDKNVFHDIRLHLSNAETEITQLPLTDLLGWLRNGKLTAVAVTNAFLRRAALAQRFTNCITELLPERALGRARFLDDYLAEHGKPFGPLHGLPISVKEHIGMKGLGLNAAYVAWYEKVAEVDARLLGILYKAGAVFHARTTQPQTLMHLETDNNLYGVTTNPYNIHLSAGGSSGGEGALVGARGSCLGIGTDIGGSIRSPAANNGVYGLKPTAYRIPTDGWSSTPPGADPIATVIGPLSTSLEGIKLFMNIIISARPWLQEPALLPIPWNMSYHITSGQPLKMAVMWDDDEVKPHPPITRALKEVASRLSRIDNVEVVNWQPYLHNEAWVIISSLYYPDGGEEDYAVMAESGEPARPLTKWIIQENPCVKRMKIKDLWYWQEERESYRSEYAKVWNDTDRSGHMVDAILCPVAPGVAPRHNTAKYWNYTSQWNLLDYPALSFPVSKVDKALDGGHTREEFLGELDRANWNLWDVDTFEGLPVSLQLVGRRCDDEKIVAILEFISKEIGLPFVNFP